MQKFARIAEKSTKVTGYGVTVFCTSINTGMSWCHVYSDEPSTRGALGLPRPNAWK